MLCNQETESISHLLVGCAYSRQVWFGLLRRAGCHAVSPSDPSLVSAAWWTTTRKRFDKLHHRCFDTLVVLTAWTIWNERNRRIFDHKMRTAQDIVSLVIEGVGAWFQAGFRTLAPCLPLLGLDYGRQLIEL